MVRPNAALIVLCSLVCFATSFNSGCRSAPSRMIISVIPGQASESMWVTEHTGVNEAAAKEKVGIYWNGPTEEGDVEQQIVLAERAIRSGNMGLILSPSNPFALNTVIQRSLDSGMSVVIVGTPVSLKPEKRLSFVLNDVEETGKLAARRMGDILNRRGEVLILGFDPLSSRNGDRSSAFEATLNREEPQISVVEKIKGPFSFGQAELAAEKAIKAHPHLSAIFSLTTTATRGAIAAVRTTGTAHQIQIVGCDHNLDLLYLLRQGAVDSLIAQNMRAMGIMAVSSVMAQSRGDQVPPYRYVKPVLLTRENIDDESIQTMLMMDWRFKS
ncbi:monosaccharide ABC transporter substrate-binding protein (CUT2 family) [Edaphobacter modestus]|uniref:Monosaccharide ABC transporter substrate-binding protein (CUT2 family) n=2 Tax=Edaphobacter modestus TaxID=388466 RepID=A0A4Q7YEC2_9BACT|nr:monosaccharide ABC transporter substrate-binding protein (CUT2 family) [Edaphobacter modestus]